MISRSMILVCLAALALLVSLGISADRDKIADVHAIHHEAELECADCHEGIDASMAGTDDLLPEKELCADCHDVEDVSECSVCHSDPEIAVGLFRRTEVAQNFPHKTHVDEGMACTDCHGASSAGEPTMPGKAYCRTCHPTVTAQQGCDLCHATGEPLVPVSHTDGWYWYHGEEARADQGACATCHTQTECQDCHAGDNVRPLTHRLNYMFDHSIDARSKMFDCASCHTEASFCSGCHSSFNVLPENHNQAGWRWSHSEEALIDMESCVSCHDTGSQSPICADCHRD